MHPLTRARSRPYSVPVRPFEVTTAIAHGRDDHFFDEEQAWLLYRRAGEPKRLLVASRFGHAEDGYTPAFAERIARVVGEMVA